MMTRIHLCAAAFLCVHIAFAILQPATAQISIDATRFVPPANGTQVTYRTTSNTGATGSYTRAIQNETYNSKDVLVAASPDGRFKAIFDLTSGTWIADVYDNRLTRSATPSSGDYQWPLQVGKTWTAQYTYTDQRAGRTWAIIEKWTVDGTETVTVPAGTFDTYRLATTPVQNVSAVTTRWYAPSLGVFVKQRSERNSGHYQGAGWNAIELTEYIKP